MGRQAGGQVPGKGLKRLEGALSNQIWAEAELFLGLPSAATSAGKGVQHKASLAEVLEASMTCPEVQVEPVGVEKSVKASSALILINQISGWSTALVKAERVGRPPSFGAEALLTWQADIEGMSGSIGRPGVVRDTGS